jgi:hypothetical protein
VGENKLKTMFNASVRTAPKANAGTASQRRPIGFADLVERRENAP